MVILPQRLLAVASMLGRGGTVADIGADHALLSIYLVETGLVNRAVICELNEGPYWRAMTAVEQSRLGDKIKVRRGDGLQTLGRGETDQVVMAGMGANTMVDILSFDWDQAASFSRYVFQPMSKMALLRGCLAARGWPVLEERIIKENGQYFIIIAAAPGDTPYFLSELEMEIGTSTLKADTSIKKEYLNKCRKKYLVICNNLLQSQEERNRLKAAEYRNKIEQLGEILGESQS